MSDEGVARSAVLLLAMGEEHAAGVLKYLAPREVQKLGQAMASLKNVTRDQIEKALDIFRTEAEEQTSFGLGSDEYVRSVLTKALGDDKAGAVIDRILQGGDTSGIEGLKWMDSPSVAELIKNEHPQIIATILVHLDRDQAAEVLRYFTERLRNDVVLRIATLDGIQPAALRELNDVLTKLMSGNDSVKKSAMGGVRAAADILNLMPASQENSIIEGVKAYDADLAQKILDQMFTWENVLDIDDRGIQVLLREVQSEALILALKGSSPEL